jgi:hypothetical protein
MVKLPELIPRKVFGDVVGEKLCRNLTVPLKIEPNCEFAVVTGSKRLRLSESSPVDWFSVKKVVVVSLMINCPPVPSLPFMVCEIRRLQINRLKIAKKIILVFIISIIYFIKLPEKSGFQVK